MQSREAGLRGEQAAAEWLIANGFELLHRNWRSGRYELDIVALREGVLHVVEVKCRRSGALSPPEEAMTPRKFAALMRAAEHYVALYGFDTDTQFDLVTVEYRPDGECDLHYFPNAMTPRWPLLLSSPTAPGRSAGLSVGRGSGTLSGSRRKFRVRRSFVS